MFFILFQFSVQFLVSINGHFPVNAENLSDAIYQLDISSKDVTKIELVNGVFPQSQFVDEAAGYSIMNEYPNLEIFSNIGGTIEKNELPAKAFFHSSIKSVSIPTLTKVGKSAFYNCTSLEYFVAEDLEIIGINAFRFCHALKNLSFPKLKKIDNYAFMNCSNLNIINAPNVEYIGSNAFHRDYQLTNLNVPKCTFVGTEAFRQTGLTTITLSDQLTTLGEGAFMNATNLDGDLTFNELTTLKGSTFQNCIGLKSVKAPKVTTIGDHCFSGCTSLNNIEAPLLTTIGYNAFANSGPVTFSSPKVETIKGFSFYKSTINSFSASELTDLGRHSFSDCSELKTVSIPKISDVKYSTFANCSKLTTLTIGKLKSVASFAFRNCPLTTLDLSEVTLIGNFSLYGSPFETVNAPKATQLGESAFAYSPNLATVNMPNLEYINNSCFAHCEKLNIDANYPNLTHLGDYAFTNTNIKSFYSSKLVYAGERAFEECHNLITAYIPETCGFIGFSLFYNCDHLTNCTLLAPVTIDDRPNILMHSPLQYLHISTQINVLNIPNLANDHQLIVSKANNTCPQPANGEWTLQKGTTVVDYDAFKWCGKIKSLTIYDTVTTIHERAFKEMSILESVKWFNADSSKLTSIEAEAFSSCTKLPTITLPLNVNKVGENIFNGDSALETINVHKSFPLDQYEAVLKQGNNAKVVVLDNSNSLNDKEIKINILQVKQNENSIENKQVKSDSILTSSMIVAAFAVVAVCGIIITIILVLVKNQKKELNNEDYIAL